MRAKFTTPFALENVNSMAIPKVVPTFFGQFLRHCVIKILAIAIRSTLIKVVVEPLTDEGHGIPATKKPA